MFHKVEPYLITPPHPITIGVVGCGGTGSLILSKLARLHMALKSASHPGLKVVAFDGDILTEANIGRQGFFPSDIGRSKSAVLIHRINRSFGLNWESDNDFVKEVPRVNIIFLCVDDVKTRISLWNINNNYGYDMNKILYIIDAGNSRSSGQVVIKAISDKNMLTMPELFKGADITEPEKPSCSMFQNLNEQDLFINDVAAWLAVDTLYKLLSQYQIDYNAIMFDVDSMNFIKVPINEKRTIRKSAKGDSKRLSKKQHLTNPRLSTHP